MLVLKFVFRSLLLSSHIVFGSVLCLSTAKYGAMAMKKVMIAVARYSAGAHAHCGGARFGGQATVFLHSQSQISRNPQKFPNPNDPVNDFHRMLKREPPPSIFQFCKIFTTLSRMGLHSKVISLFTEMGMRPVPVPLDLFTFNVVINSCIRLRNGVGVCCGFSLLGAIVKNGYEPNTVTFSHLIRGLILEGRNDDALRLYHQSTKCCKPDVFTYGIVIDVCCKMGNVDMAIGLLRDMKVRGCKPNTVIYGAIIHGLCQNGRVDVAFRFFGEMVKIGVMADLVTFNTLVKGLFLRGEASSALKLFRRPGEILRDGQPDQFTYGTVIDMLCKMGNVDSALALFLEMKSGIYKPNAQIYSAIMDGLCKSTRVEEAFVLFVEMEKEGVMPDVVTFNILINGLRANGKFEAARELFNILFIKGIKRSVVTYNIMINGMCEEGFLEEAEELMVKMEEDGCKPNEVTFNTIINGFLRWNERYKAMELVQKMVERKFPPYTGAISSLVNFLVLKKTC